MVGLRHGDNPISFDVSGTALDVLANTEHLVVAGSNCISILAVGLTSVNTWFKLRSNRELVRLLKFNPLETGYFASVSGQFIDIYTLGQGSHIQLIASFTAHSRKVSDFCWYPFDDQLMISAAENDSVSFWDLRTDLKRPNAELSLTFGAGQSKFAPHLNNYLLTTHGTDVQLWDLRYTFQPITHFSAHQSRVLCLDWHPHHQEPNSFFTSSNDSTLKLWNMTDQKSVPKIASVVPFGAWRFVFSQEGEELAALSLPPLNSVAIYSNYGLEKARPLKGMERDTLVDAAWHKSTTAQKSTTKFLYTLSMDKQKVPQLCRHAIAYELSNELRDEMATPITQSKTDEERDRMVANVEQCVETEMIQVIGVEPLNRISTTGITEQISLSQQHQQKHSLPHFPIQTRTSISAVDVPFTNERTKDTRILNETNSGMSGGGGTPRSPIYSEWQRWIRAPNIVGGDLLTELEALRKHTTEGLYTTEVNFTRAAIGFSYMHLNKYRKINFEMRFHREFIENGLVFVEVIQKDSPFTSEKAFLFLTLLQQESDEQLKIASDQTILCRVLQQLPRIIDMMKVFTTSIDVLPSYSKASSQSGSASEEQILVTLAGSTNDAADTIGNISSTTVNRTISTAAAVPCSYIPSPYDIRVPAPRNCGARFNKSGYLVAFGPVNTIFPTKVVRTSSKLERIVEQHGTVVSSVDLKERIPRIVPSTKGKRIAGGSLNNTQSHTSDGGNKQLHPRSLAEYCVFVNPTPINFRQTSVSTAPVQCSPPGRCVSPNSTIADYNRPSSPWPVTFDTNSNSMDTQQPQQQNSLSPPSIFRQIMPTTAEEVDEQQSQSQRQQQLQYQRSINSSYKPFATGGGPVRVLGSSPNSSAAAVRSYSLQNVAQSVRYRGSSMTGAGTNAIGDDPMTSSTAATTLTQQQSMVEHGSTVGPAAVMPEQSFNSVVVVYDATTLLPISKKLARTYKLLGPTPFHICRHNLEQAAKHGRKDLVTVWKLVEQCVHAPNSSIFSSTNHVTSADSPFFEHNSSKHSRMRLEQFARIFHTNPDDISRSLHFSSLMETPWAVHPLGRGLINRILEHYTSKFDIQTAAVIACVLNNKTGERIINSNNATASLLPRTKLNKEIPTQTQTVAMNSANMTTLNNENPIRPCTHPNQNNMNIDVRSMTINLQNMPVSRKTSAALTSIVLAAVPSSACIARTNAQQLISTSREKQSMDRERVSPAFEQQFLSTSTHMGSIVPSAAALETDFEQLLAPELLNRFEELKKRYSDILYRWGMYMKSAEVLKHCIPNEEDCSVGLIRAMYWCSKCGQQTADGRTKCNNCRRPAIYCAICEQPCRGVVATCVICSHGGHFIHISQWFNAQSRCPLGCGCECKF